MNFINYLESIAGVGIFPLISLLMFFVFFSLVAWYVWRVDEAYVDRASRIPLLDEAVKEESVTESRI